MKKFLELSLCFSTNHLDFEGKWATNERRKVLINSRKCNNTGAGKVFLHGRVQCPPAAGGSEEGPRQPPTLMLEMDLKGYRAGGCSGHLRSANVSGSLFIKKQTCQAPLSIYNLR